MPDGRKRMRMPGFEPGISQPQCEVLTTILHTPGEAGYRSQYLSHAKRALYHLSYIPISWRGVVGQASGPHGVCCGFEPHTGQKS